MKDKKIIRMMLMILLAVAMVFAMAGCGSSSSSSDSGDDTVSESTVSDPTAGMTASEKNAYNAALNYLDTMPFSKAGLIDQLSSDYGDGYPEEDAKTAVEALEKNGEVDWVEQAKIAAKNYLDMQSFSKDGLIDQLESEYGDQYTHEQAVEAVDAVYK